MTAFERERWCRQRLATMDNEGEPVEARESPWLGLNWLILSGAKLGTRIVRLVEPLPLVTP